MNTLEASPLAVCLLPEKPKHLSRTTYHPDYIWDILGSAGVCYAAVELDELPGKLDQFRVLMTVGEATLSDEVKGKLEEWVRTGGAWLSVSGTCGMDQLLGVEAESASFTAWGAAIGTLGEGYLKPIDESHPILAHLGIPLHYFNGIPVHATHGQVLAQVTNAHQHHTKRAAVVESVRGKGRCVLIAPDVTGSVVRIQQGVCVTRDGVPSPDGTGGVNETVLKTDDGQVLDWIFDREPVPGVPGYSAFLQPVASQWREMILRALLYLAHRNSVTLPLLWFYPRNLPAIGHLSHDSDNNDPECAIAMLDAVCEAGIKSTWCVHVPGYTAEIVEAIRKEGHELAMHYDAMSDGTTFCEAEFKDHFRQLTELYGGQQPVSNKNHYLRWEGDVEFYLWCEDVGIKLDESKGASKTGEAGFNFGACHPYFPLKPDGSPIDVLELPTYTQDLIIFAPQELAEPLLNVVYKHAGVAHFLFHPAHILKPGVREALVSTVVKGKKMGLEWWTARDIGIWERARRKAQWSDFNKTASGVSVKLHPGEELKDATIFWLNCSAKSARVNGTETGTQRVERFGFEFESIIFTAEQGKEYEIQLNI